ncbi:MAG: PorV/PorQ family protein [Elusimicrobia bacterium]|nr:PorV/PorQ family protein [Elusimicrobiota bacterium]
MKKYIPTKTSFLFSVAWVAFNNWIPACSAANSSLARGAAPFLRVGVGARPSALGHAYVAIANDSQAIYFNPAGLAFFRSRKLGTLFSPQSNDQTLWSLDYANPLGAWGALGVGLMMQEIKAIEARQNEFDLPSIINSREGAVLLSYGYPLARNFALGATVKYLFHTFTNLSDNARGYGLDLGVLGNLPAFPRLTLGASAQNVVGQVRWSTGRKDPLLFIGKVGFAYRFSPRLMVTSDLDIGDSLPATIHGGAEFGYSNVRLMAGFNQDHPTFGFGAMARASSVVLRLDYAFELDPKGLNDVNRFSLSLVF